MARLGPARRGLARQGVVRHGVEGRRALALPVIGSLYSPSGDALPGTLPSFWSQPGGPGTTVYPQPYDSAAGEFEPPLIPYGMYSFMCRHIFNLPAIFEEYDPVSGEQAAIICCPVCTLVQQIIIPYSEYQNYLQTPLVVA